MVTVLDVGGGAGVILSKLAQHLEHAHGKKVVKYCLDLSPGMLVAQKKNNPDAVKILERDIADTGLGEKEVDLILMIDVLEHVKDPVLVLREIRRIASWAVLKVPLEDTFYYRSMDWVTRGRFRARLIEEIGHVNVYDTKRLLELLERELGSVCLWSYTNVYRYLLGTPQRLPDRVLNLLGLMTYRVSPGVAARLWSDYLVALVRSA